MAATSMLRRLALSLGVDDALIRVHTIAGERDQRLTREVADHPTAIGAADDDEPDERVGEHIGDQPLWLIPVLRYDRTTLRC